MNNPKSNTKNNALFPEHPVMEIFGPTIQGEGILAGLRTHFVRFGGCGYRCSWCDSMHAVDPKLVKQNATKMDAAMITAELKGLNENKGISQWVTLSGGDPCMHDLAVLVQGLRAENFTVAVETQGQLYQDWLPMCHMITVSPKPPSSGECEKLDNEVLAKIFNTCNAYLKIVIFTPEDLEWAKHMHNTNPGVRMFLSVGTDRDEEHPRLGVCSDYRKLCDAVLKENDLQDVTILPQLHVLAWGHKKEK